MATDTVILVGVASLVLSLVILVVAWSKSALSPDYESREQALARRVGDLEEDLRQAEIRRVKREAELQAAINALQALLLDKQNEVFALNERIRQLESRSSSARRPRQSMVVAFTEQKMLEEDLAALRGVTAFRRDVIRDASKRDLRSLIDERRGQGQPVRYVHLAMHADEQGVAFADGLADGLWLSEALVGVEVLVIAGCKSTRAANLVGSVPIVVSMRADVDSGAARIFSRAFWGEIADGADPEDAFYAAVDRSPAGLGEMVELKKYYPK